MQAQKVLRLLLRYGALADDDLAFLWNLTQDGTTFEGVRANVYSMLGQLAPQLKVSHTVCVGEGPGEFACHTGPADTAAKGEAHGVGVGCVVGVGVCEVGGGVSTCLDRKAGGGMCN